jgi:hypothetical protein
VRRGVSLAPRGGGGGGGGGGDVLERAIYIIRDVAAVIMP